MSKTLIITGMHRSATSLVASVFLDAGLHLGRELYGAGPGNPRGHFEDWDFQNFHQDALAVLGHTPFTADRDLSDDLDASHRSAATALVARRAELELWGWKDPRTCLFLELWQGLLPDSHYLFLYRHPADVVLSLMRRDTDPEPRADPWSAIESWSVYNRLLLETACRHPERVFVAHAPTAVGDLPGLVQAVRDAFGLPLRDVDAEQFRRGEFTPEPGTRPDWSRLAPEAMGIYRRLDEIAGLPAASGSAQASARVEERLLYELLEGRLLWAGERERAAALAAELARIREQSDARRRLLSASEERLLEADRDGQRLADTLAQVDGDRRRLATVLSAIDRSRAHAVVKAWWSLRRWLAPR